MVGSVAFFALLPSTANYPCRVNLSQSFAQTAEAHAAKVALCQGGLQLTYGQLLGQTRWLARRLREELGVRPGDRVGVWLKNGPAYVPALFAIWAADAVAVPINNFLKPAEVDYIAADAGLALLLSEESLGENCAALQPLQPRLRVWKAESLPAAGDPSLDREAALPQATRAEGDLALIIYTSGTTGHPKGAMLSHGNLLHNVRSCYQALEWNEDDRIAVLLPMFHSFMLTVGVLLPMLTGGSMLLVRSLHPAKNILQEIILHHATILPAVPQLFRTLAHDAVPANLPLRLCISGAAPLPVEILQEFSRRFPIPLLEGYGLSEASPVVSFNPLRGPWKAGSIGVPITGVEVSVQDEQGNPLPPLQTGEVCVRGGNVMLGYWNQPEATAKTMRDGWLLTGDIGHADSDGYFYITDRKKDMLLVNGINVYPRQIEELLYSYPGVREAAVIGVPDPRRGEQPVAYLSLHDGKALDEKALAKYLRERLADYKVPRRFVVLPNLPRNATGKIVKPALRELAEKQSLTPDH